MKRNHFPQFDVASYKRWGSRLSFEHTATLLPGGGREGKSVTATMFRKMLLKYAIFSVLSKIVAYTIGTLRSNNADGNENVTKTIGLISKTTTSHVHHTFLYISFPFLHDYDVKMPNFAFYGGRKQATTKFYFSFWARNSASGGFAYNWQSKLVEIIAIKTERTQIHFLSDVLVAVASLDLKVPNMNAS